MNNQHYPFKNTSSSHHSQDKMAATTYQTIRPPLVSTVVLPIFDAFLMKRRLATAIRLLPDLARLYNHVHEIVNNLCIPNLESDIPLAERQYLVDMLNLLLGYITSNMPTSILLASLEHAYRFVDMLDMAD
jgi:hypothetical protein